MIPFILLETLSQVLLKKRKPQPDVLKLGLSIIYSLLFQ